MDTAAERDTKRSAIESEHNGNRDAREKQYIDDREALEIAYRQDLNAIRQAKLAAYAAAGLNSDGTDPQARPLG